MTTFPILQAQLPASTTGHLTGKFVHYVPDPLHDEVLPLHCIWDSSTFYGKGLDILPFQGVCQGNGAGLAV